MKLPTFDIRIATDSLNTQIICNGEDISSAIQQVQIIQKAGSVPIVTLQLAPTSSGVSVRAQCEAILELQDEVKVRQSAKE